MSNLPFGTTPEMIDDLYGDEDLADWRDAEEEKANRADEAWSNRGEDDE